jgi:hypothetical protein
VVVSIDRIGSVHRSESIDKVKLVTGILVQDSQETLVANLLV